MCGIAGFLGDFDQRHLRAMSARIAHRGPDDADLWWNAAQQIGFAHRRLAIIDLSAAGRQPMWAVTRQAVIVYNGELYNYRELARDLRRDGFAFHSATDTEVILNLYLRDGEGCLERLNGIFAFALWDVRKRHLLLARDGVGVKPLYYSETSRGLVFASELKALCALPELDRTLDHIALSHYITCLYAPAPRTPFKAVRKLEPGTAMIVENGRIKKTWRFWQLPVGGSAPTGSIAEQSEKLETLLSRAVKRQMIADVPVGSFLSGGLDSSSLVVFARQYARERRLECFTIGFKDSTNESEGFPDDLPYAQRVAEHLGVPLHIVWTGSEMASEFERMVYQMDEPQPDPAALNVLQIARLAHQHGSKVLLSGAGGDDIFGGYRRHYALQLERWWHWMPQGARALLEMGAGAWRQDSAFGRRVAKALQFASRAPAERLTGYFAWLAPQITTGLFAREVRAQVALNDPLDPLLQALGQLPRETSPLGCMLNLEQRFFLPDHNLNYTDKMAMAVGVEVRVPFLDPDLMSFAASLPDDMKQRGAIGKWLFKKSMEVHLPRDVIYRPKAGFGAPLRRWMREELRDHFETALVPSTLSRRGIFDVEAVSRLVQLDRAGRLDAAYPLFALVCIETWCRHFLDPAPAWSETDS